MFVVNEKDFEYRFGDSGPKYLMKGPRMNVVSKIPDLPPPIPAAQARATSFVSPL